MLRCLEYLEGPSARGGEPECPSLTPEGAVYFSDLFTERGAPTLVKVHYYFGSSTHSLPVYLVTLRSGDDEETCHACYGHHLNTTSTIVNGDRDDPYPPIVLCKAEILRHCVQYQIGPKEDTLMGIPVINASLVTESSAACNVCMEEDGDLYSFHQEHTRHLACKICCSRWLARTDVCPVCRMGVFNLVGVRRAPDDAGLEMELRRSADHLRAKIVHSKGVARRRSSGGDEKEMTETLRLDTPVMCYGKETDYCRVGGLIGKIQFLHGEDAVVSYGDACYITVKTKDCVPYTRNLRPPLAVGTRNLLGVTLDDREAIISDHGYGSALIFSSRDTALPPGARRIWDRVLW